MTDLRIGVLGTGGRGGIAAHAHKPGEGSRIVACCDLDADVLAGAKERYGADIVTTREPRDLLTQELDAAFVCTPDWLHEEHALLLMDRVPALFLEKPMAITVDGCDRILQKSRETRCRLFVGHNMRYMAFTRAMKSLIDDGAIGEPKCAWCRHFISYGGDAYFRDWHADRTKSTGLLLQKGAHDIDILHWLLGGYATRVSAFGTLGVYNQCPRSDASARPDTSFREHHWPPLRQAGFHPVMDVEDQSVVNMQLPGGMLASYLQCHFTPDCWRNYTVIGTEGRLENYGDGPDSPVMLWNKRKDTFRLFGDEIHRGEIQAGGGHGGADPRIVDEFLRFARDGGGTTATPEAARMSVAVGCLATESLRSGGAALDVPPLPQ